MARGLPTMWCWSPGVSAVEARITLFGAKLSLKILVSCCEVGIWKLAMGQLRFLSFICVCCNPFYFELQLYPRVKCEVVFYLDRFWLCHPHPLPSVIYAPQSQITEIEKKLEYY